MVDLPGSLQHHQPRRIDLRARLGDPRLHNLTATKRLIWRDLTICRSLAHQAKGTLTNADPAHTMMDPPWPQAILGDHKSSTLRAEPIRLRDTAVIVRYFAVAGVIAARIAHHRDVAYQFETRRTDRYDDLAGALMNVRSRISDSHTNGKGRPICCRGKPFLSRDHIIRTIFGRRCAHPGWIRARIIGFSHRKAASDVAANQRLQIAFLLLLRAVLDENLHIADIGSLAIE